MEHVDPSKDRTAVELPDLQERARNTPLTEEAQAHLLAAGSLADKSFDRMRAIILTAIHPLVESNRHVGFDLTLSDEEVYDIVEAVRAGLEYGSHRVVAPIFARGRGEKPYVRDGDEVTGEGAVTSRKGGSS